MNLQKERLLLITTIILVISTINTFGQIDTVLFNQQATHLFPSFPIKSSYTSLFDRRTGFDYIYSANKESGLGIYDISSGNTINLQVDIGISNFNNLDVSTIEQKESSLYVGLGDFQVNSNTSSGLAILDVSNPLIPVIKDVWDTTLFTHGISHILIDGSYAYLSTMSDGLFILDISNENNIEFKSHLLLDLDFPAPSANAHNARGLKIKNDTLYMCFDRGGLRIVDVTNKSNPIEIYKYINTTLNSQAAAAYNDIAIKEDFAFISVDYCGLEVLDISSIPFISILWYDPWGCNFSNWSGADLHMNEVMLANLDSLLFVTGGQSELLVFDVTNPLNTTKVGEFVNLTDTLATYGLDVFNNKVVLSLVNTPFHIPPFTPFFARPGGLKLLSYQVENTLSFVNESTTVPKNILIYPNPSGNVITIKCNDEIKSLQLNNSFGQALYGFEHIHSNIFTLDVNNLKTGVYFLTVTTSKGQLSEKFIVGNQD